MKNKRRRRRGKPMSTNVLDYIAYHDHDRGFEPTKAPGEKTPFIPGSVAKIERFAKRIENGQPLFVDGDATCFDEGDEV